VTAVGIIHPSSENCRKETAVKARMNAVAVNMTTCTYSSPTLRCSSRCSVGGHKGRRVDRSATHVSLMSGERSHQSTRTVPHREGTIQSLGSLSVNAMRLQRYRQRCSVYA
jgi:hypothetical protein